MKAVKQQTDTAKKAPTFVAHRNAREAHAKNNNSVHECAVCERRDYCVAPVERAEMNGSAC